MIEFVMWSMFALGSYYLAHCATLDMPWIKINKWLCAAIGFLFGWFGLLGIALYLFYNIAKNNHRHNG